MDGQLHRWRLGFRQSSFRHITRVPQHLAPYAWARPLLGWHAVVPLAFRRPVSHQTQKPPSKFLPAGPGIRQGASWRRVSFATRMRSSTRAWRRCRSSRSARWRCGPAMCGVGEEPGDVQAVGVGGAQLRAGVWAFFAQDQPGARRPAGRVDQPGGLGHPRPVAGLDLGAGLRGARRAGLVGRRPRRLRQQRQGRRGVEVGEAGAHGNSTPHAARWAAKPWVAPRRRCAPTPVCGRARRAGAPTRGPGPGRRRAP